LRIPQESKLWVWLTDASRRIGNSADPYTDSGLRNKHVSERPTRFTAPQIAVLTRVDIKRRSDRATRRDISPSNAKHTKQ
jgi:hypothetical protein